MDIEIEEAHHQQQQPTSSPKNKYSKIFLLSINTSLLVAGTCGTPLLLRMYFLYGGSRKWLSSFVQAAGFPLLLPPLLLSFLRQRRLGQTRPKLFIITPSLFLYCSFIGLMTGLGNFLYTYGAAYLPVSTSSILIATQLGFTAFFSFLVVRQKFTALSVNAVVLLTIGAAVLGIHAGGDRPEGESRGQYYLGFFVILSASGLFGLILPVVELVYSKTKQAVTYTLVTEMQVVVGLFATLFALVGMVVNNDFQVISREAKLYGLGETKYYLVLAFTALASELLFLGLIGTISYSSALFTGIIIAVCVPLTDVLGVIFFNEKFDAEKGIALVLCLWGSASYFYGEYKENRMKKKPVMILADESTSNFELLKV